MRFFAPALAAIMATAAIPSVALADISYTFNVPVAVTNLSKGSNITVECSVYNAQNGQGTQLATGTASLGFSTTNGVSSGTAAVPVSSPTLPVSYKCWFLVYNGSTVLNIVNGTPENPQPGWKGNMLTSGNF
jgi:hypothetical protein